MTIDPTQIDFADDAASGAVAREPWPARADRATDRRVKKRLSPASATRVPKIDDARRRAVLSMGSDMRASASVKYRCEASRARRWRPVFSHAGYGMAEVGRRTSRCGCRRPDHSRQCDRAAAPATPWKE